jgi:tRNA threonylcarbamoyladenosine biosynthesis protein TsaE
MRVTRVVITRSDAETEALGKELGLAMGPGAIVYLVGDLGAGKTVFVRGLAAGLDVDPDEISSPTFTLIHEYRGRLPVFHVDLYRLDSAEVADLELDAIGEEGVMAIEWADRLTSLPNAGIVVRLEHLDDRSRRISITTLGKPDRGIDPAAPVNGEPRDEP